MNVNYKTKAFYPQLKMKEMKIPLSPLKKNVKVIEFIYHMVLTCFEYFVGACENLHFE